MEKRDLLLKTLTTVWGEGQVQIEDLPAIDLYMDQVTTLLEDKLGDTRRGRRGKPLTATMLGNYTKEGLLKKIKGKKYPREHLLMMVLLYHLKGSLPLGDIKELFDWVEEDLTLDKNHYDPARVESLFADFTQMQQAQLVQMAALTQEGMEDFDLGGETPEQLLRSVLYFSNLANLASAAARELITQYALQEEAAQEQQPEDSK